MLPRALQSWRAVPRTLVGDWWRREEGGRQRWEVSAEGAQLARVPCTKARERGAQHRQSAAASGASRTAMGLSRSPRPPPLVILLLVLSLWLPLGTGNSLPTENRLVNSCTQARKKCEANPACKAAYQHLGSCTPSLSSPLPSGESATSAACLEAAQQLRNSSLIDCRCHRRMKHQATCLDIYWTVHPVRSLGDYELDVSPYEDTVTSKPWKMNLSKLSMLKPDSDLCLKFAMLCTLNDKCDRLRKAYGEACSGIRCQRHLCLAQLRSFFEKAAESHAQGLLLCPCAPEDAGCGERRRNTIAPSCALPSVAPNCLDLRSFCRADPLCRSRLMDFQTHCHPMDILGTCATEQSRCLRAYLGLIGEAGECVESQ